MTSSRGRSWFEVLFREHHARILAYAVRRVGGEADDVVAEVFAVAWRRRGEVPDDALPWLYRTAGNVVMHVRRGAARREALADRLAAGAVGPASIPLADEVAEQVDSSSGVRALFAALPDDDAEVLRLWAWEDLGAADLGYVLGCSAATARMRLHRARRRARALLGAGRAAPPVSASLEGLS